VILGGAAEHRWATDVDVFDRVDQRDIWFGYSFFEWIQVHHHQIDRGDLMFCDSGFMLFVTSDIEESTVNQRMKGLHPAIQHFRETGVLTDVFDGQTRLAKNPGGTSGGKEFDPGVGEGLGEGDEPRLVGNGK
jgi:hypothetical protein